MIAHAGLLGTAHTRPLHLLLTSVVFATGAIAQRPAQQMIVWQPGMDHAYQDGWLKAEAPVSMTIKSSWTATP